MVRGTDSLDMAIAVDWDVKNQTKQTKHTHMEVDSYPAVKQYPGFAQA